MRISKLAKVFFGISIPLAIFFGASTLALANDKVPMKVISVGDGDTVRLENNDQTITVRLGCIDAPETSQNPWGSESSQKLKQLLLLNSTVQVREITQDRYGRTIAEIYQGGHSINLEMVSSGMAAVYQQYLGGCADTRSEYLSAETQAQRSKLGFWNQAEDKICLPWNYRKGKCHVSAPNRNIESLPSCVSSDCNCSDFSSHAEAQRVLESFPGDRHRLDRDKDGIACESLR